MIASFPWYDLPSVQWANDAIWEATGIPGDLERTMPVADQWRARNLLVSQSCGLDLFVTDAPIDPVLAPVFDLDCAAGRYFSYLVRSAALSAPAAVNSLSSRSGLSTLLAAFRPRALLVTGSHRGSIEALQRGAASVASIDAVSWHILERDDPGRLEGLTVVERSAPAPSPPYVVRRGTGESVAERLRDALDQDCTRFARRALYLRSVVPVTRDSYRAVQAEYECVKDRIPRRLIFADDANVA